MLEFILPVTVADIEKYNYFRDAEQNNRSSIVLMDYERYANIHLLAANRFKEMAETYPDSVAFNVYYEWAIRYYDAYLYFNSLSK